MVERTLDGMAAGGMYDLVGGGFHRYSVDERWLVPHFEKMLYDNALLGRGVPARLGRDRRAALPRGRRGDARLRAPRAAPARRRPRLGAGRRHERRRGAHVHLDGGGGRARPSCCSRSSTAARSSAASSTRSCAPGCSPSASCRPQPGLDDKVLASWNGLALAALAEGARRLERADWLEAARGVAEFLLGPLSREDGRLFRSWRARQGERRGLPRRLRERRARAARAPRRDGRAALARTRRTGSRCSRSSCSHDDDARRLLPRADGTARSSSRARRGSTTTRSRPATRCSPTCCCGSRGSGATTSSSAAASSCSGSSRRCSAARPARSAGRSARSTSGSRRRASSRSSGRSDSPVARAALAPFAPNTVVAVGPADGVPLLDGKGLVDGDAGGLRLRAVRLPGARHRSAPRSESIRLRP